MHNVTPHVHAEGQISHKQNSGGDEDKDLFDFLVNSFQLDFGEGHLECFSQLDGPANAGVLTVFSLPPAPFCPTSIASFMDFLPQEEVIPRARDEVLICSGKPAFSPLRAPPIFA